MAEQCSSAVPRRIRLGMVGGGPGGFIGAVHRIAARLDECYELVAAALTSDAERSRAVAAELHIPRAYGDFAEMAAAESKREDRIDAVAIVTPNHLHFAPAKAFLEAGQLLCRITGEVNST
jgi:predicted dehydrogenase